jgi:hypothetical protein
MVVGAATPSIRQGPDDMSETDHPVPDLPQLGSRADFGRAVHWFTDAAIGRGARTLYWLDPDFRDWPLDEPGLLASLNEWLRLPLRRLVMVAGDWGRVPREHPRFCAWRLPRSHALDTRRAPEEWVTELPSVLYDDGPLSIQVLDRERWRGRSSRDPVDAHRLREQFDALVQRSTPDFAATTLGL